MIGFCKIHGHWSTPALGGEPSCPECAKLKTVQEPPKPHRTGGLDLAKVHDYTAMTELRVEYHHAKLVAVKVWPHVDYSVIIEEVAERYGRVGMETLGIDATGVGEPIGELLRKVGVRTDDIKFGEYVEYTNPWGMKEHASVKYAMVEYGRACMQSGFVEIPEKGSEELRRQLSEQEIVQSASERVRYAHPEGRHDDLAWAFLINLYISRRWVTGTAGWLRTAGQVLGKTV